MTAHATRRDALLIGLVGALIGVVLGATLMSATTAGAANGDHLVMGTKNTAGSSTKIRSGNSTQLINTKAGRPALRLYVKGNTPPLSVDSSGWVQNLNADYLDNRSVDQIKSLWGGCIDVSIPDGQNTSCVGTITLPRAGVLLLSGSIDFYNQGSVADTVWCHFRINGSIQGSSDRDTSVNPNQWGSCATDLWVLLPAGTYTVAFQLEGVAATTNPDQTGFYMVFIPD